MARNITKAEKEKIRDLYSSGLSYRYNKGKGKISPEGRNRLSESSKKACQKQGKVWTKPEREFKVLLNEMGLSVRFPDCIKEIFDLEDDPDATIYFQYPFQRYLCDYAEPEKSIVYRINGDFWHANPILYDPLNLTKIQQHNIKRDKLKKQYLESKNWMVVDVWESEIKWNRNEVFRKITEARSSDGKSRGVTCRAMRGFESRRAYSDDDWSSHLRKIWFKKKKGRPKRRVTIKCPVCNNDFEVAPSKQVKRKHCSQKCQRKAQRKVDRPSKKDLSKDIESLNWVNIGRKYGVSDNAVRKWARHYNLI